MALDGAGGRRGGSRWAELGEREAQVHRLAVGEAAILLHPPLPLVGVSVGMERGCQQNGIPRQGLFIGALKRVATYFLSLDIHRLNHRLSPWYNLLLQSALRHCLSPPFAAFANHLAADFVFCGTPAP